MNNDVMIKYVKRWRDIKKRQSDLDYERSLLASDIRAEFDPGSVGDSKFVSWCLDELRIDSSEAVELLARAAAVNSVRGDEKTWKALGGFRQVRHIVDLPRTQRTSLIGEAISSEKALTTLIREKGILPHEESGDRPTPLRDARELAEFIRERVQDPPPRIKRILSHYAKKVTA